MTFPCYQVHLTNHVVELNHDAFMGVGLARVVYHDYRDTLQDMMEAGQDHSSALERLGDDLVRGAEESFPKLVEKKEDHKKSAGVRGGFEFKQVEKSNTEEHTLVFNLED